LDYKNLNNFSFLFKHEEKLMKTSKAETAFLIILGILGIIALIFVIIGLLFIASAISSLF
jgi:hypothetical protein